MPKFREVTNHDIGERVRELRKAKGWTASGLSDLTDGVVTRGAIAKIENGLIRDPKLSHVIALADAFDVTVEDLLDRSIPPYALFVAGEILDAKLRLAAVIPR